MSTQRRFLIAPSFARLIQRERSVTGRIVEAYFPPRPDRRQLVRVEQRRSQLVLLAQADDGSFAEEATEIPLLHAEALIDVAAGTVAYDRTSLPLGGDIEGILDRFIIPRGLDLLTVTIPSDPHAFAPLRWFGLEVTDEPAFGALELALQGAPGIDVMEPSNAALEALLDTLEGHSFYQFRSAARAEEGERGQTAEAPPSIPAAVGLDPNAAATRHWPIHEEALASGSKEDEAETRERLSIRQIARSLAPRNRDLH